MAGPSRAGILRQLNRSTPHSFSVPVKKIEDGSDVDFWLTSWAYTDLMTFLLQLNAAMFPRRTPTGFHAWAVDDRTVKISEAVARLSALVRSLETFMDEAPPDPGPRRFGNLSFRKWYQLVEDRLDALLEDSLPRAVLEYPVTRSENGDDSFSTPKAELKAYLLGSFGSSQRLDYGTGHELSFLAFLGGIWRLGGFDEGADDGDWGDIERQIMLGVIEPYFRLVRKLILAYTLEPAGSHGVWGLDDHSFMPYIFGSAQLGPPIDRPEDIPQEGSVQDAPRPGDVMKSRVVEDLRGSNMYFSAIGFIYDVKKGPFWEHSPMLFDISGVTAGWAKINKGMIKMFNVEVLSKLPVVQHFPFGSLFQWARNPDAASPAASTHTTSQPQQSRVSNLPPSSTPATTRPQAPSFGTAAPWTASPVHRTTALPGPHTSWTGQSGAPGMPATRAPWADNTARLPQPGPAGIGGGTAAPWAGVAASRRTAPSSSDVVGSAASWASNSDSRKPG